MSYAIVNGTRIFYVCMGAGPPVYVIHGGLGLDHTFYPPMFESLHRGFQFVYFDLRYHGRSEQVENPQFTYEELADDIEQLRQYLGHGQIVLLGHSAGGWIAQFYAAKYPESLTKLVLFHTSCQNPEDYADRSSELIAAAETRSPEYAKQANGVSIDYAKQDAKELAQSLYRTAPWYFYNFDDELQQRALLLLQHSRINQKALYCDLAQRHTLNRLRGLLLTIHTQTLVVTGRHDFWATVEQAEEMHRLLPQSTLKVLEESAHFSGLEQPEELKQIFMSFMDFGVEGPRNHGE